MATLLHSNGRKNGAALPGQLWEQSSEEPIRIAYLVSAYPAVSHTFILREVQRLRRSNFEIYTASINAVDRSGDDLTEEEQSEAAATFYIKREGIRGAFKAHSTVFLRSPKAYLVGLCFALRLGGTDLRRLAFAFCYFVEAVILGRWMESRKLSHLHIHFANAASAVGLITSHTFPIRFSLTVHGPDEFYDAPGLKLVEKVDGATFVCCIGQFARSQLMKLSPPAEWSKFEIGPLGVDPQLFTPRRFRANPDPIDLLCIGRLVSSKGQHVLLAAVEHLVKSYPNIRLRLVGDGPDREGLKRTISSKGLGRWVTLEGSVNQDRIREYYRQADIFVLPSFAEGIPVVLMEAMATEIPCVSTFVAGIPELIRNDIDGILVPPSDDQELAGAIRRLIDDPCLRRRLGAAGRGRVMEKYDLDRNIAGLADIFTHWIGARRKLNPDLSVLDSSLPA